MVNRALCGCCDIFSLAKGSTILEIKVSVLRLIALCTLVSSNAYEHLLKEGNIRK